MATDTADCSTHPQIGVLCVDVHKRLLNLQSPNGGGDTRNYIPCSYVKFLEGAGANVVPIWIGQERVYYENILSKINGILIPGGTVFFKNTRDCTLPNDIVESSRLVCELAKQQNDNGTYFPIWGTCLGYELLLYHAAAGTRGEHQIRERCDVMKCSLPVNFVHDFRSSRMFANINERLENIMRTEPFGVHIHIYCITEQTLKELMLDADWHILAKNEDSKGLEFITFVEHKKYPFYGCQIHLERVAYENSGKPNDFSSHTDRSLEAAEYFAKFFVSECCKCKNRFDAIVELKRHLICNFKKTSTVDTQWLECYLFDASPDYNSVS